MYQHRAFRLSALSAAITSTILSNYAVAAEPLLEEVLVTATRRAETVQDVPINITALSSDLIERERLSDLSDIAKRVPGMTVVDQGPRSGNTLTMRGLTVDSIQAQDQSNNTGGTVATYVGDIPFYVDLRLKDMERIEVLQGPQGTLYGAGTLGGAVRYIPNKPQADALALQLRGDVFDLSESSNLGYDGGATVNIPIIADRLAVRASLDQLDDPGFIDYNYLVREAGVSNPQPDFDSPADVQANLRRKKDANTEETLAGRLAMRYTDDLLDGTLTYYYQDAEIGARQINHKASFGTGDYEAAHRFVEPNDRKNELLSLELVADLGFAELTSATGYGEYTENGRRDQTDLLLSLEYYYQFFPSFAAFTREDSEEETFTQELRLVSTDEGPWNWIAGAFYRDFELNSLSREFTPQYDLWELSQGAPGLPRPDSLEYYEQRKDTSEEFALFGELGYQITDAWQVTVGARWFKFDTDTQAFVAFPLLDTVFFEEDPDAILPTSEFKDKVDDDDTVFKFNTSYDLSDDAMLYFTVSEGYRLGGINPVTPCPEDFTPGLQNLCALPNEQYFQPDKTTNYELGLRSQWGDSVLFNAALFYLDWDDTQLAAVTSNGALQITSNAGAARSMGVELTGQWFVTENLSLTGTYAYTDAELTDDAPCLFEGAAYLDADGLLDTAACLDDPLGLGASAYDGDRLPGTPEHQGYLGVNYGMDLSGGARLEFDWAMTAVSDVLTKVGERNFGESLDGYALHNVATSWVQDALTVTLYADNVFDEYAETGVRADTSYIRDVGLFDMRRYYHDVVRPRQVGVRFIYNFDF